MRKKSRPQFEVVNTSKILQAVIMYAILRIAGANHAKYSGPMESTTFNTNSYCRKILIGGNYGHLNTTTFVPNPDF